MKLASPMVSRMLEDASRDPEAFWACAAQGVPWLRRWDRVFEHRAPTFRWFVGGETNLSYSALDHHVGRGRGGHAALVYLKERGERATFTYTGCCTASRARRPCCGRSVQIAAPASPSTCPPRPKRSS